MNSNPNQVLRENQSVVENELVEARRKLDEVYNHIKKAMAYVDDETYNKLETIRTQLVRVILDIDAVIYV